MREESDFSEAIIVFRNDTYVIIEPWEWSIDRLRVIIKGKEETPYEKGQFIFEVKFPENYPFQPPFVHSHTEIWHPHIDSEIPPGKLNIKLGGLINPDLVGKVEETTGRTGWMPENNLNDLINAIKDIIHLNTNSIHFLIEDPLNREATFQYVRNRRKFDKKAREWTFKYAINTD